MDLVKCQNEGYPDLAKCQRVSRFDLPTVNIIQPFTAIVISERTLSSLKSPYETAKDVLSKTKDPPLPNS